MRLKTDQFKLPKLKCKEKKIKIVIKISGDCGTISKGLPNKRD